MCIDFTSKVPNKQRLGTAAGNDILLTGNGREGTFNILI